MYKTSAALVFLLLMFIYPTYGLVINEVMYDPLTSGCSNDLCEWLELYNNGSADTNLFLWTLDNGTIGNYTLQSGGYFIITNRLAGNDSFESVWGNNDGTWNSSDGNFTAVELQISLRNTNDTINLTDGIITDLVFYDSLQGGNGNNRTLCRFPDGNTPLAECETTPGFANLLVAAQPNNQTNQTNSTSTNVTDTNSCELELTILANSSVYNAGAEMHYDLFVNDTNSSGQQKNVTIEYFIEDLFGKIAKNPDNVSASFVFHATTDRQWTPAAVTGSEAYIIMASIVGVSCNDTDASNNAASKLIVVKGTEAAVTTSTTSTSSSGSSSGGGGGGGGGSVASNTAAQSNYDIVSYSDTVAVGGEFTTRVKITNSFTTLKNYTVYSYAYKGNTPVSLGYDETQDKWLGTYTANQRSFTIGSGASATLDMKNIVEDGTEPGTYNLRVRIKVDNSQSDITKQITVTGEAKISEELETATTEVSDIEEPTSEAEIAPETASLSSATGLATARSTSAMRLLSPISILLEFLSSLLNR